MLMVLMGIEIELVLLMLLIMIRERHTRARDSWFKKCFGRCPHTTQLRLNEAYVAWTVCLTDLVTHSLEKCLSFFLELSSKKMHIWGRGWC